MSRLVVVSNRVTVKTDTKAKAGGLAVALQDALQRESGIWFGWSGKTVPSQEVEPRMLTHGNVDYATLDLSRKNYAEYYSGFANRVLWPLFHYRLDLTNFFRQEYAGYQRVNRLFAEKLLPLLKDDDLIWVHDYHLIPLGEELRRAGINRPMGFFLHTPFPAMEVLTTLPTHQELVRALCAYDVIGFQTGNDLRAFCDYIVHEVQGSAIGEHTIQAFGRSFRAQVFPIGIDTDDMVRAGERAAGTGTFNRLYQRSAQRTWIIGVDRLDYSKGISERFVAMANLLERYPDFLGKLTMVQIAPPSRAEVPEYKQIRKELEEEAGHINGRFAQFDWVPINYISQSFTREQLAGYFRASRIGLVTPLRDGMNLVAKEYVAAQDPSNPGVLVLSRFAGAAREMHGALIVNPFDRDGVADAIVEGLHMPLDERRDRYFAMMNVLQRNTLFTWLDTFLDTLRTAPFD
ncbi:MAG: alpha,alpha-trehalose-phosphate synthase (UDP-forming) [Hyphomicrobiales bacterium]|nr:alpha,alpha-trehalose-phosphate synthase (UDP-forming) [Hyphomicrobiales bacterium]MCP5374322.1 alpha,alpha-trehalose-phosphate synthase (UDP-forming) [Hyphomicrobiales bacterium]